ncbi:photosystem reaction center subunit H [Labrys miyagiensis]|uniref:Photosystem reaction center subunit H n=1 Tax=Labrys miyagiensis TaxID=346912 RepID=A0ABQ6CKV7_9HYPH|nr:PRC-barrel domain-containing protein [Labrys miyagiensis]GLS19349.1 photosystem reaction center subunit H [Labrys miyagiensis]
MPTTSGHTTAILASRVQGSSVYNVDREKIGSVEDLVLDKTSNEIMFAVLGFGGLFGVGEKYFPIPWSKLDYDPEAGGYVICVSTDVLETAPSYTLNDLTRNDGQVTRTTNEYYMRAM